MSDIKLRVPAADKPRLRQVRGNFSPRLRPWFMWHPSWKFVVAGHQADDVLNQRWPASNMDVDYFTASRGGIWAIEQLQADMLKARNALYAAGAAPQRT